jgi:hypothetical protein
MFRVSAGKKFVVSVFVTRPEANVVVVETELALNSTPFCIPAKMPSWAEAGRGRSHKDPATTTENASAARLTYFSPITATQ